jgi:cobalt-zinc-cadmium efflux system protein
LGGDPHIEGAGVIILGIVRLVINGAGALGLHRHAGTNLNLRAAVSHLAVDALGSVVVLIVGVSVQLWDATWTDPVASLLLSALVLHQGWRLLRQATVVLLEAAPGHTSAGELVALLNNHDNVEDVHHVHVWSLDSETSAMTAHVVVDITSLHEAQRLSRELEAILEEHGVEHSTLSLESHVCDDSP